MLLGLDPRKQEKLVELTPDALMESEKLAVSNVEGLSFVEGNARTLANRKPIA